MAFSPSPSMPLPSPSLGAGSVSQLAPVSGVLRVLVIAVTFADLNNTLSTSTLKQEFFGQVAAYYHEISYGTVSLQGDVVGWYKLPNPLATYGMDCMAIDDADCSGADGSWQVARDAVALAQKDVNFTSYDYYVFIHAGYGEESSGVKNDIWSVTYLGGVYVAAKSKTLTRFEIVPELEAGGASPVGVYSHEFGHQLGLPDLYNTNTGKTILGPWSLMDKGLWNGDPPGSSPSHMEAWSKIKLGFISGSMVAVATSSSNFTIDPTEIYSSNVHAVQVPISVFSTPSQYYLVEVRSPAGFDTALPAFGVLISYVDETATIGRVRIMDGHPTVPALGDAVWNVGQTFADTKNQIAISINKQIGQSYQVTVTRGSVPPPNLNQTYIQLGISRIFAQPSVITSPNTTVTILIDIANSGTQSATNVPIEVDLDNQNYVTQQVNVNAGSTTETSVTWTSELGGHTFRVVIDPNGTIQEPNRNNHVATFTLNVGPTLSVSVPSTITANATMWVIINGVKYNLTSSPFQASVPAGTVTVQIQPTVNTSLGVRQRFAAWSDGSTQNPRVVVVQSDVSLRANYTTQYLLTIDPNRGKTSPGGWYDPKTIVYVQAQSPTNVTANSSRLIFLWWSGDLQSNSTNLYVNVTRPISIKANWLTQYYVTVISPAGAPSGSGWYNAGDTATISVNSQVEFANATRLVFTGWNGTSSTPTMKISVKSPTFVQAGWRTQYLVQINSVYGNPTGSGWYDAGTNTVVSVKPTLDYGNGTRRVFAGWTGDYTGMAQSFILKVNSPKAEAAAWITQDHLTFRVSGVPNSTIVRLLMNGAYYNLSVNNNYQSWFNQGVQLSPSTNQTIIDGFYVYHFSEWQNSTGRSTTVPITVNGPQVYTAYFTTEVALPPIPGFELESILLGILIGLAILCQSRRYRHER